MFSKQRIQRVLLAGAAVCGCVLAYTAFRVQSHEIDDNLTQSAKTTKNKKNIIAIKVKTKEWIHKRDRFNEDIVIYALYSVEETVGNVFDLVLKKINKKYKPTAFKLKWIEDGFIGQKQYSSVDYNNKSLTDYDKNDIIEKGLLIRVEVKKYIHEINNVVINCPYMDKLKTLDPLQCPIYSSMKERYIFTENNLLHLQTFVHFSNEFEEKIECKYGEECNSFLRLQKEQKNDNNNAYRLDDQCHILLYRHPPRNRNIKLSENVHSLMLNKNKDENHAMYKPTEEDKNKYQHNDKDGYLQPLIDEVVMNGYKTDLCLYCGGNDECKHEQHSILSIVDDKMKHIRHQTMGYPLNRAQMLSLILYTGCDCNYDLCKMQRNGNYIKWKWFDYCLFHAIFKLSAKEEGSFSVYTGLNKVKLSQKSVKSGYFVTYVSSSWKREIAQSFMNDDDGMMIDIDEKYKNNKYINCCNVSWISKFPDECEILFARSVKGLFLFDLNFNCIVLDESNGVQNVALLSKKK